MNAHRGKRHAPLKARFFKSICHIMDLLDAYSSYEVLLTNSSLDELIPKANDLVWMLGKKYDRTSDIQHVQSDAQSLLWFSYRKGFPPIGTPDGPTSDKGWGCMFRCAQMAAGNTLLRIMQGGPWSVKKCHSSEEETAKDAVSLFLDAPCACGASKGGDAACSEAACSGSFCDKEEVSRRLRGFFSLHEMVVVSNGGRPQKKKQLGEWVGPNSAAHALRKLGLSLPSWCAPTLPRLCFYVAMDNTLTVNEARLTAWDEHSCWRPLLLFVPLRLGLSETNPKYIPALKASLELSQSMGIIGGRPNHALFFIGYSEEKLIYLDPHVTQAASDELESFHCATPGAMPLGQIDPSVALCFYCASEADLRDVGHSLKTRVLDEDGRPLVLVQEDTPTSTWLSPEDKPSGAAGEQLGDFSLVMASSWSSSSGGVGDEGVSDHEEFEVIG